MTFKFKRQNLKRQLFLSWWTFNERELSLVVMSLLIILDESRRHTWPEKIRSPCRTQQTSWVEDKLRIQGIQVGQFPWCRTLGYDLHIQLIWTLYKGRNATDQQWRKCSKGLCHSGGDRIIPRKKNTTMIPPNNSFKA